MLKDYIKRAMRGAHLEHEEMTTAMGAIMDGEVSDAQIAAFLVALRLKGETTEEIAGAAEAMRARMTRVSVSAPETLDTCGTGGDGAGTFNISTAVAFVLAAAGVPIAKHGNRAVSSRSGSADVLKALGVNVEAPVEVMRQCIDEVGIGFLFAPTLHPAMKHAAGVRRELGIRTIFNVLGPLTNPAGARRQLMGVFDAALVRPIAEVLGRLGSDAAWVVHGADGLDEITVCDTTSVAVWDGSTVSEMTIAPEAFGIERPPSEGLKGGTPEENAGIMREILAGQRPGPIADAVILNAGAGLVVAGRVPSLREGVDSARGIVTSGAPLGVLDALVATSQG